MPEREALTRTLLERNRAALSSLAALPFVRALIVSGGVAHKNPGARPDVDFFVVTARGRAYTAYAALFLATKLTSTRRLICPNYLVDESELTIAYHRDLFTAHQLVSALPFTGHETYEALCRSNEEWVRPFFPAFAPRAAYSASESALAGAGDPPRVARRPFGERALGPIAPALETILRWGWRFHLRRRAAAAISGDVILGAGILKLHLSDHRQRVMDRFAARLDELRARGAASDSQPRPGDPAPAGP
jgi:hypothetical protein